MLDDRAGGERGAMPADADERLWEAGFGRLGQIHDLGDVRQIIAAESDDVGPPAFEHSKVGAVVLDLKIYQSDRMPRPTGGLGHEFETDRLESQKDLGVMENAGENAEKPHSNPRLVIMRRSRQPSVPRLRSQPTRPPLEQERSRLVPAGSDQVCGQTK